MSKNAETKLNDYIKLEKPDFQVVQIGANDGKMADPIHNLIKKYKWNAVLVEPVTYIFNKLKNNYKGVENIIFENCAISDKTGVVDFYQFPEEYENDKEFPFWAPGMGSLLKPFDSPGHRNLKSKNFTMIKKPTNSLTFNDLLEKHKITKVDLLQIDIEGYDGQLLCNIDFNSVKPRFIRYEDRHIQRAFNEGLTSVSSTDVVSHLNAHGYTVDTCNNGFDKVCMLH